MGFTIIFQSNREQSMRITFVTIGLLILFSTSLLPLLSSKQDPNYIAMSLSSIVGMAVVIFMLWIWKGTQYRIKNEILLIKSGPFKWQVAYEDIKHIYCNQKTIKELNKPALSWNGIVLQYGKNQSIAISPEKEEQFIELLKERNHQIEIS